MKKLLCKLLETLLLAFVFEVVFYLSFGLTPLIRGIF